MNQAARLGAVLTVGSLILVLNVYAVVNGHWKWSFEVMPVLSPGTAVEVTDTRLPTGAS